MQMPSLITTSNWFVSPGEESQQSLDSPWCRFQMGLMTRIFWRGMLRVLPGALSWIKGTCLASALRGCCQVLLLQLLELQQPVGNMGHHQCSSTASHPQWPHRWPKCHCPASEFNPVLGDTAQSQWSEWAFVLPSATGFCWRLDQSLVA